MEIISDSFVLAFSHKARMHGFCVVGHFLQSPKPPSCSKFHSLRTVRSLEVIERISISVHLHTLKNCSPPVCLTIFVIQTLDENPALWVVSRLRASNTGKQTSHTVFVTAFSIPIPIVCCSILCAHTHYCSSIQSDQNI